MDEILIGGGERGERTAAGKDRTRETGRSTHEGGIPLSAGEAIEVCEERGAGGRKPAAEPWKKKTFLKTGERSPARC